jgi:antitoxin component YwqK of YwqJK toxin-antitoxin module
VPDRRTILRLLCRAGIAAAAVYLSLLILSFISPLIVDMIAPEPLHYVFPQVGVFGKIERTYYANGRLGCIKRFETEHTIYGPNYLPFGTWQSSSPDGTERYTITCPKPTGHWVEWYANGNKRLEEEYAKGEWVGLSRKWHENGNLSDEEEFDENGRLHGTSHFWLKTGERYSEKNWEHGKPSGMHTEWYANGHVKEETEFKDGQRVRDVTYAPDGHIGSNLIYPNPTGHWIEWFENGAKYCEGEYMDGEMHGTWTHWDRYGGVYKVEEYDHGKQIK